MSTIKCHQIILAFVTAILHMGVPVGSKLFSTTFASKTIDCFWAFPDFVSILIPPFSSTGFTAEAPFPAGLRLYQKLATAWTDAVICHNTLDICLRSLTVSVQFVGFAVISNRVSGQVESICNLPVPGSLCTKQFDLFFLKNSYHLISSPPKFRHSSPFVMSIYHSTQLK